MEKIKIGEKKKKEEGWRGKEGEREGNGGEGEGEGDVQGDRIGRGGGEKEEFIYHNIINFLNIFLETTIVKTNLKIPYKYT